MTLSKKNLAIAAVVIIGGLVGLRINSKAENEKAAVQAAAKESEKLSRENIRAEGRVTTYPGAMVDIGTEASGRIVRLLVQEQQTVKRGDLIAELAAEEETAALAEAKARIAEAETDIAFLTVEQRRADALMKSGSIPQQGVDKIRRDLDASRARKDVALASVRRLEAMVAKSRITSPIDGTVTHRYVEQGEIIPYGTKVVSIANLDRRRVEAEIDEYDAGRVRVGDSVIVFAEGFENFRWTGRVEMIPDAVTPRSLSPLDPGRPSDTRVLLVKATLPLDTPLKLGQRVEVEIVSKKEGSPQQP